MKQKNKSVFALMLFTVVTFGATYPASQALAVLMGTDTAVLLTGSGINLILTNGSTMTSYSASATTLTLNLDVGSNVTVKSTNLYTLTNSLSSPTQCSGTSYSYVTFTSSAPASITITPSTTIACTGGSVPAISSFTAAPTSITSGSSATLTWTTAGATTLSLDQGIGDVTSTTSKSVSPTATTIYTLTAVNGTGTTTATATVTVFSPSGGGGGGGGGGGISPPTIISFKATPTSISSGQTSTLSWQVSGASRIFITPATTTSTLPATSGSVTITPALTTVYLLTAQNYYNQTVTASTTITVLPSGPDNYNPPVIPTLTQPSLPSPEYCLVNNSGTFYLILSGIRHGIANPGLLYSYGYGFTDAIKDTPAYQALSAGELLLPNDGALVKSPNNPTVFLAASGSRHGFVSASVFKTLGYKFSSVLVVPETQLKTLPEGSLISNPASRHLRGANINYKGTIYYMGESTRYAYPSLDIYNSWNLKNDFSRVVPANAADLKVPVGSANTPRTSCSS